MFIQEPQSDMLENNSDQNTHYVIFSDVLWIVMYIGVFPMIYYQFYPSMIINVGEIVCNTFRSAGEAGEEAQDACTQTSTKQ